MITRTTLRGPAGGRKKKIAVDEMNSEQAINFLRMDFDLGFSIIEITDTCVKLDFYDHGYVIGTHKQYEGSKREMKTLTHFVRAREVIMGAVA